MPVIQLDTRHSSSRRLFLTLMHGSRLVVLYRKGGLAVKKDKEADAFTWAVLVAAFILAVLAGLL